MDLCLLSTVKGLLGIEQEVTVQDDTLQALISGVSAQIERYLGRTIESGTYTEYFSVEDGASTFAVKAYPVTAVTSVKNAYDWSWSTTSTISLSYVEYTAHPGLIYVYGTQLVPGHGALQIIYTGGCAANTSELVMGSYADIALAAAEQTVVVWRNRMALGVQNAGAGANSASYAGAALADSVKELLDPHRRRTYV